MSQAMEEQRLKGLLEEEERQAQAAIEAAQSEASPALPPPIGVCRNPALTCDYCVCQ